MAEVLQFLPAESKQEGVPIAWGLLANSAASPGTALHLWLEAPLFLTGGSGREIRCVCPARWQSG